ncbi:iron-siderophore ABC transporter substrate-binding protein [Hoeflea olei]|uniref:Fe/B12 periplasmic-binding domain-containing protein n=1 Tax=Hoeflea olei TaxID=1480615 RepID=A0A1C1YVI9_9HYPH|nr:iron-siderophore ABC transporter substrate-binding protein [Hoeflea olei]OCW57469.1 hypothetical protein AWJ14_14315 [Hoeflea olei]
MRHRRPFLNKHKDPPLPDRGRRGALLGMAALSLAAMTRQGRGNTHFPVTIAHAFGETTVARQPLRVVTLGWGGEDAVIALGTIPVAMTRYPYWQDGISEWNAAAIGPHKPALLGASPDYERIALLKPDLILAVFSGVDELSYRRLSRIAPVVTFETAPFETGWDAQLRLAGRALGRDRLAQDLVARTEETLDRLRRDHPGLRDRTAALVNHFPAQAGIDVYLEGDTRFDLLKSLGLVASPGVAGLGRAEGGRYSVSVGLETIDLLDADVVVGWFAQGLQSAVAAQPLLGTLPAIREGRVVTLDSPGEIWPVLAPTAPSILHGYPRLARRIADVLARRSP